MQFWACSKNPTSNGEVTPLETPKEGGVSVVVSFEFLKTNSLEREGARALWEIGDLGFECFVLSLSYVRRIDYDWITNERRVIVHLHTSNVWRFGMSRTPLQVGECFNVGQLRMFDDQPYKFTQSLERFETFGGSQTQLNERPSCLFRHKFQLVMGGNLIDLSSSCVCHDFLHVHFTQMFDVLKHWTFTVYE